jgi:membrane fusion protein, multidrug efflux system
LLKQSAISKQEYDVAEAAFKQATTIVAQQNANLSTARFNLDKTTIIAPLGGYIGRAFATRGSLVTAYQSYPLATIQARDPIFIDISVSSELYSKLKQEDATDGARGNAHSVKSVTLYFEDGTPYLEAGRLQLSNVAFDRDTGKVLLRAIFPNSKMLLLPGMNVHVKFSRGKTEGAILIPKRAIRSNDAGKATVLILDNTNIARERIITLSHLIKENWLVSEGLRQGDRVVADTSLNLRPNSRVHPISKRF